jgi:3-methyl-2-oxobutanoate hydroxymethyltransferase
MTPPSKIATTSLRDMKRRGEKITALTAYDAPTARLLDETGVDVVLVGDSVANVKLGYDSTLPVTLEEMIHHTRAVRRGLGARHRSLLVADMPFLTYEYDPREAVKLVGRLMKEGGAEAVKVEGASPAILRSIRALIEANIPVMGHLGLTPQSVHRLGGYRVQGRDARAARALREQAQQLEKAGVFAMVLEAIPALLARAVTKTVKIPTIGIGAGLQCDGQILVVDDLLGLTPAPRPRFVRAYADLRSASVAAVRSWSQDVRQGRFPGPEQTYA